METSEEVPGRKYMEFVRNRRSLESTKAEMSLQMPWFRKMLLTVFQAKAWKGNTTSKKEDSLGEC